MLELIAWSGAKRHSHSRHALGPRVPPLPCPASQKIRQCFLTLLGVLWEHPKMGSDSHAEDLGYLGWGGHQGAAEAIPFLQKNLPTCVCSCRTAETPAAWLVGVRMDGGRWEEVRDRLKEHENLELSSSKHMLMITVSKWREKAVLHVLIIVVSLLQNWMSEEKMACFPRFRTGRLNQVLA